MRSLPIIASAGFLALSVLPAAANVRTIGIPFVTPRTTPVYTYIDFPKNNSIHEALISTFPLGVFKTDAIPSIPYDITASTDKCGTYNATGTSPCDYYAFGFNAAYHKIVIKTNIAGVTTVYSLMNAFAPVAGKQLGYVVFYGSKGAKAAFALVAGADIRDYYYGSYATTLSNDVANVKASPVFSCIDPKSCLGSGGTGNVATGDKGTYVIDQQAYQLPAAFKTQNLTEIAIVDSYADSSPILLALTAAS